MKKGQLVNFESGRWEEHCVYPTVYVEQDFKLDALLAQWLETETSEDDYASREPEKFIEWLKGLGLVRDAGSVPMQLTEGDAMHTSDTPEANYEKQAKR